MIPYVFMVNKYCHVTVKQGFDFSCYPIESVKGSHKKEHRKLRHNFYITRTI